MKYLSLLSAFLLLNLDAQETTNSGDGRVVINDNAGQTAAIERGETFNAVVRVVGSAGLGTGVLVAPSTVLTARHNNVNVGATIQFGADSSSPEATRTVSAVSNPAGAGTLLDGGDFTILTLSAPVPKSLAAPMYVTSDTTTLIGKETLFVGYGYNGIGSIGHQFTADNIRWAADNTIDAYGTPVSSSGSNIFSTDFDDGTVGNNTTGTSTPLPLEGTTAPGDSGGPLLVRINGKWAVAGVLSGGTTSTSVYGDVSWWTGLAPFTKEIEDAGGHIIEENASYITQNATVDAMAEDSTLLTAPSIYSFDTITYTPSNSDSAQLPTSVLIDAAGATASSISAGDFKYIYYDSVNYQGSATRTFAVVKVPAGASAANPVPAVVLVHGGGGSAYHQWVTRWVNRGYAAISIAVEGQTSRKDNAFTTMNTGWNTHNMSGPIRPNIYDDTNVTPLSDQWMYRCVADTMLANSLMRSLSFVDSEKVGVMGISWGGVITSTTIGIDDRFAFAVPTYGCGHLFDADNIYEDAVVGDPLYEDVWDPFVRLSNTKTPTLWFTGVSDPHFPMDSLGYCYHEQGGPRQVAMDVDLAHGNTAWANPDSYDFADSIVNSSSSLYNAGLPWCSQESISKSGNTVTAVFKSVVALTNAALVTTPDLHNVPNSPFANTQVWTTSASGVSSVESPAGTWTVTATLPNDTKAWYINVENSTLSTASSDYQEVIEVATTPSSELLISIDGCGGQTSGSGNIEITYDFPHNIEISDIRIANQSSANAFTLTSAPTVPYVENNDPSLATTKADITVSFDNTVASLNSGQQATGTLIIEWENLDKSKSTKELPLRATITSGAGGTVVFNSNSDLTAQSTSCCDTVIINNNATVTIGENLISNGSFESPVISGFNSYNTSSQFDNTNWPLTSGSVTLVNGFNGTSGSDGSNQWLSLQEFTNGEDGTVTQTISTIIGQEYQLKFDYSTLSLGGTRQWNLTYNVGQGAQSVIIDETGIAQTTLKPWATETHSFTATATTTTISFQGDFVSGFFGPGIDNVRVTGPDTLCLYQMTVNNSNSPTTATLEIVSDIDIFLSNAYQIGTGSGSGIVNQSAGSITTPDFSINTSNTGDSSLYNLTGGSLILEGNAGLQVNAGSQLTINGGTVTKNISGNSNNSLGTTLATGLISMQSGSLQFVGGVAQDGIVQNSPIQISGGDFDIYGQFLPKSAISITGDSATVNVSYLNSLAGSNMTFELGATGVSPIDVTGWASVENATITVDGSNYTGGAGIIPLINSTNLLNEFTSGNITLSGFSSNGLDAVLTQDLVTDDISLTLTAIVNPFNVWASSNTLTGADATPTANPDGDLYSNIYEFAFNGDPEVIESVLAPSSFDGTTFSITRRSIGDTGLTYQLQETSSLLSNDWTDVISDVSQVITGTNGDFETVEYTKTSGNWGDGFKGFLRLKVEYLD